MLKDILKLKGVTVLSRAEQKNIGGGRAAAGTSGTCAALVTKPNGQSVISYDINKATVDGIISGGTASGYRVQWCCDNCSSASWL